MSGVLGYRMTAVVLMLHHRADRPWPRSDRLVPATVGRA